MKSKLIPILFSVLLSIALVGCSGKSKSAANVNSANANTNPNANIAVENENANTTTDEATAPPATNRAKTGGNNTRSEKPSETRTQTSKRPPEKEPPVQSTGKQIKKQGDRALREAGGLINEGERRVRGILNGRP